MHLHRRIGIVLVALSTVLAAASLVLSTGWRAGVDFVPTVAVLLQLQLFDEAIDFPTKYALLACMLAFALGILFFVGVFAGTSSSTSGERTE